MNFIIKPRIFLLGLAVGCICTRTISSMAEDAKPVRVITADWRDVQGPHSEMFRECIGAGRAEEGLRADWQQQLKLCQDEIGFKYIRFHGLLNDEMGAYSETRDGQPRHNWQYIDALYDALLATHIRPFVEISFMPSALASGTNTVCWWKGNITPPKSYDRWDDLIRDLTQHWTERYGADEVKQWYFEIWNEPDHGGFFAPHDLNRRQDEYFELYTHTANDIKSVNADYRVGGPAGAGTKFVLPLIGLSVSNNVPLDFISFHSYGGGASKLNGFDPNGDRLIYLGSNLHGPADSAAHERAVIDTSARPTLPIYITEWSASYSDRDPAHDAYFSAPYILEQFKHSNPGISAMSYWVFTDIFEELGPSPTPFFGGFGLLNFQGIKKPAYFAYQFMARLGPTELKNDDTQSWVCRDDQGGAQILLWDLTRPAPATVANQNIFKQLQPAKSTGNVRVSLTSVPRGKYRVALYQVGFEKNDTYSAYLKIGSPAQLTRAQEKVLRDATAGNPEFERVVKVGADGKFSESLPLREDDALLLTLTRE
ncbi:MAG TPA: hypothetical protein VK811_09070 [Candidatus Acidoferrum sp.]|nr:hypothetical protein [Candidatus Acidoferrum sp.]